MVTIMDRFRGSETCAAFGIAVALFVYPYAQAPHKSPPEHTYRPFILPDFKGKTDEFTVWRTTLQSEQPKRGDYIPLSSGIYIGVPSAGFQMDFAMDLGGGQARPKARWQVTGAEHVFVGKVNFAGYEFESDPSFPLTFQVTTDGYQYLCGRGTVRSSQERYDIDGNGDLQTWLKRSSDSRPLVRQGAVQALGWLVRSDSERKQAQNALTLALKDADPRVRRNAAEAIGKIGAAADAKDALAQAMRDDKDDAVIKVIKEVSAGVYR